MSTQRDRRGGGDGTRPGQNSEPDVPIRAVDRILAFTALTLAAASVLCFFAIIIGSAAGMDQAAFGTGVWPVVAAIPLWGLPIAFVLIISLLVTSFIRKGRAASGS